MTSQDPQLAAAFAAPSLDAWTKLVEKALKGADFERRLVSRTADGIHIAPLSTRRADASVGTPVLAARAGAAWEICQLCRDSDPAEARAAIAEDIAAGAAGLTIALEAPGQAGLPPQALADVLADVPLAQIRICLGAGERTPAAVEPLSTLWQKRGVPAGNRRAAFNHDPIGTLSRYGGLEQPLDAAIAQAARLAAEPRWAEGAITVLLADGRPVHEAGGSEAQELGAMLASLVAYLRACELVGLRPAEALSRTAVGLSADADLFLTIAKLRAARLLVRRIAATAGADRARDPHVVVSTSERMMTRRDPWVNLLRTCAAGMGAALGGADGITIQPFSSALGRPDAFARRIARNMHVVLAEESGLGHVADPSAGAWHIEALTRALAEKGWAELQAIEAAGGMAAALRSGLVQERVATVASERQKSIVTGRAALTGVSAFPLLCSDGIAVAPSPAVRLPVGTSDRVRPLAAARIAAPFEHLRDAADAAATRAGKRPAVFLASLGGLAEHSARSTWIANFLAAGGIDCIKTDGFTSSADAGRAFAESGAEIACICGTDDTYALLGEATAGVLRQVGAKRVLLAGRPKDESALRGAGVDDFLHAGQDALAALERLHSVLGIA